MGFQVAKYLQLSSFRKVLEIKQVTGSWLISVIHTVLEQEVMRIKYREVRLKDGLGLYYTKSKIIKEEKIQENIYKQFVRARKEEPSTNLPRRHRKQRTETWIGKKKANLQTTTILGQVEIETIGLWLQICKGKLEDYDTLQKIKNPKI